MFFPENCPLLGDGSFSRILSRKSERRRALRLSARTKDKLQTNAVITTTLPANHPLCRDVLRRVGKPHVLQQPLLLNVPGAA